MLNRQRPCISKPVYECDELKILSPGDCSANRPPPTRSPTPKRRAPSPPKSWAPSSSNATPIVTSSLREVNSGYDEEAFGASGRKKRLAALAAKFSNYDADDAAAAENENNLDVTREIDVDEELAAIEESKEQRERGEARSRSRSPLKSAPPSKDLTQDDEFVRSLRAQGFEESNSKTKLVYDFKKTPQKQECILYFNFTNQTGNKSRFASLECPFPISGRGPECHKTTAAVQPHEERGRAAGDEPLQTAPAAVCQPAGHEDLRQPKQEPLPVAQPGEGQRQPAGQPVQAGDEPHAVHREPEQGPESAEEASQPRQGLGLGGEPRLVCQPATEAGEDVGHGRGDDGQGDQDQPVEGELDSVENCPTV